MSASVPAYAATVLAGIRAAEVDGRLPAPSAEQLGDIFPFESPVSVVPFEEPTLPEPPRRGEAGVPCGQCATADDAYIWTSPTWRLRAPDRPDGVHTLWLEPREHLDQADLTPELAAELGVLLVRIERDPCLDRRRRPRTPQPLERRRRASALVGHRAPGRLAAATRLEPGALARRLAAAARGRLAGRPGTHRGTPALTHVAADPAASPATLDRALSSADPRSRGLPRP